MPGHSNTTGAYTSDLLVAGSSRKGLHPHLKTIIKCLKMPSQRGRGEGKREGEGKRKNLLTLTMKENKQTNKQTNRQTNTQTHKLTGTRK